MERLPGFPCPALAATVWHAEGSPLAQGGCNPRTQRIHIAGRITTVPTTPQAFCHFLLTHFLWKDALPQWEGMATLQSRLKKRKKTETQRDTESQIADKEINYIQAWEQKLHRGTDNSDGKERSRDKTEKFSHRMKQMRDALAGEYEWVNNQYRVMNNWVKTIERSEAAERQKLGRKWGWVRDSLRNGIKENQRAKQSVRSTWNKKAETQAMKSIAPARSIGYDWAEAQAIKGQKHRLWKDRSTGYERAETKVIKGQKHRLLEGRSTGYKRAETQAMKGQKHRLWKGRNKGY